MGKKKVVTPPVEVVVEVAKPPVKWIASWLLRPKCKSLPPGVTRQSVVKDEEPTRRDRRGELVGPPLGGGWVAVDRLPEWL